MEKSRPFALRPPEKIETPYDVLLSEMLWPYDHTLKLELDLLGWPQRFCSDDEMVELSGIPLPSLRALQTAEVVFATKAPVGHGTHRRVWHLHEVAVANAINCWRSTTNSDFKTVTNISFQIAVVVRIVFAEFVRMAATPHGTEQFGASIILAQNRILYLWVNPKLKSFSKLIRELINDETALLYPFAVVEGGMAKAFDPANRKQQDELRDQLKRSRFFSTVNLSNVFDRFEEKARDMRTPS